MRWKDVGFAAAQELGKGVRSRDYRWHGDGVV
jgi:hypothetical protein